MSHTALSNATVAAGMVNFSLRRAQNVHWQAIDVDGAARAVGDDSDEAHNTPLVLGTASPSMRMAWRRARPKAL